MTTMRTAFLLSTASAALVLGAPAVAQTSDAAAPRGHPAPAAPSSDSDIIVTAQKRPQLIVDVPQAISVISGATLEQQQANSFQDYLKLVPGLQLDQSAQGRGRLILRGLNTGGVASTTTVYVDETPFGSSSALVNGGVLAGDFDTFDVARVEVLRGPQGTFYGANSLGGLLKFVTNAPDPTKLEVRARGAVETTDGGKASYGANAVVNLPLGSSLAARVTGFYRKDGGFIDSIGTRANDALGNALTARTRNDINGATSYGGRASLLFKPTDTFDVRLTAFLQNIRTDAPSLVESDPNTLQTLYGRPTQSAFVPQFANVDYRVYNGTLNYDFGFAKLTSSTSYSTQDQTYRQDATFNLSGLLRLALGAPANELYLAQQTNNRKFTQEVRLASGARDRFEWLLGGYYTHEKGKIVQQYVDVVPGTLTPIVFPFTLALVNLDSKYEEYAGFGNATVHLGDRLSIDLGGRYSHNDQTASQSASGVLAGNVPVNSNLRSSDDVFTYSVAPKFKLTERASVYARVAKGYRPGGPNVIPPTAAATTPATYAPDTTTNYEVGFKGETADRTFALDVAAFHIDWDNIQLLAVVNNFGVNINGAGATSEGVEFTATARPTPGLVASINGAYTRAKLGADTSPLVGGRAGDQLPFTPRYSVGTNLDYGWSLGDSVKASLGGSLRFLSKQNGSFDDAYRTANGRQRQLPSYEVVDLHAGLDFGRFGVEAFVRNLTNAGGKTSTGALTANGLPNSPNGALLTGIIRPRTIGLSVTASY